MLDEGHGDIRGFKAGGKFERGFRRHFGVQYAVQEPHRTGNGNGLFEKKVVAAVLDEHLCDDIRLAVIAGQSDLAVFFEGRSSLRVKAVVEKVLGKIRGAGKADN